MTLNNAKLGNSYIIDTLNLDQAVMRRLEALGLTKGTNIKVLNRSKSGSVILMVRGSRLALGNRIVEAISTKECTF